MATSAIERALEQQRREKEISPFIDKFGISDISLLDDIERFVPRVRANPKLGNALKQVKEKGLKTRLYNSFSVGSTLIFIKHDASDEEIIDFILGKKEE